MWAGRALPRHVPKPLQPGPYVAPVTDNRDGRTPPHTCVPLGARWRSDVQGATEAFIWFAAVNVHSVLIVISNVGAGGEDGISIVLCVTSHKNCTVRRSSQML